jgi:antitoxin Phd
MTFSTWKLQDAKAQFSEVVRRARNEGPQHITVHGKDSVVVMSVEDFASAKVQTGQPTGAKLVTALRGLQGLHVEREGVRSPVRADVIFD